MNHPNNTTTVSRGDQQQVLQMVNDAFSELAMAFPDAMKLRRVDAADRAVLAALASPKEAPATPQAAMSALQIADCVTAVRPYSVALATVPAEELIAFVRNIEAALTQPTTVQQADALGLLRRSECFVSAYADRNPKWDWAGTMQDPSGVHALLSEIRAALKGMQPGERKEQE